MEDKSSTIENVIIEENDSELDAGDASAVQTFWWDESLDIVSHG